MWRKDILWIDIAPGVINWCHSNRVYFFKYVFISNVSWNETKIRFKVSPAQSSQKIIKNSAKDLVKTRVIKIVKNSSKTCQLNCQELIKKSSNEVQENEYHSLHANLDFKKSCLSQKWAASLKKSPRLHIQPTSLQQP